MRSQGLAIKNRSRLPAGRNLTVSVVWLRLPSFLLLTLLIAAIAYWAGVLSGTSGWYRETVSKFIGPNSAFGNMLLAVDKTPEDTPLMRNRLMSIESRLTVIEKAQDDGFKSYDELAVALTLDVQALLRATEELGHRTNAAKNTATKTDNRLQALILAVDSAQQARRSVQKEETNEREGDDNGKE